MDTHDIDDQVDAWKLVGAPSTDWAARRPAVEISLHARLRDTLEAIGFDALVGNAVRAEDVSSLLARVRQALLALDDLWLEYESDLGKANDSAISAVGELTSASLMNQLVQYVRQLERAFGENRLPIWSDVTAVAMSATRWVARWSWLRYKQPATRVWANAAYLYEASERWQFQHADPALINAAERSPSVMHELTSLLFAQWVSPLSLSLPAQLLLDRMLRDSAARPAVSAAPTSLEDAAFDVGSGLILLQREITPTPAIRFISFGQLRDEICKRATHLVMVDVTKAEPAKQLLRTVVGRRTRKLSRLGSRVEMLRRVQVCVGYRQVTANQCGDVQRFREAFVLDRSEEGCRIRFDQASAETNRLCVGALLQVQGVFDGEVCIGFVRWLKRIDPAGWEAGVWLIRGTVLVRNMRNQRGAWPTGAVSEAVSIIDVDNAGSGSPTLAVLPMNGASVQRQLVCDEGRFRCNVLSRFEVGADFEIAVVDCSSMKPTK
ncbi:hypothetical protein G3O06_26355 [Burkholderia sp. Ac-20345]|uniref:hypothetical protein n=1 Tax=Burkholderia sp. Ac-20345 TaxID=2703891 RepID=UPI00197B6292|nr:hypothetical protein [Burkholderia sp. Ac-20345]MBN3781037.1 hypothetical protein [Burkholderia sp. Ac-20345]